MNAEREEVMSRLRLIASLNPGDIAAIKSAIEDKDKVLVAVPKEHCFLGGEGRTIRNMFMPCYHLQEDEQYYEMYWYKTTRPPKDYDLEVEEKGGGKR